MTNRTTLNQLRSNVRRDSFFKEPSEVPTLEGTCMSPYEQDELLSEILGSQLRRRAMSRYSVKPDWAQLL